MNNPEVKFKYIHDDNYTPEYINGAYGGINPNGELVVNFFMDIIPVPDEVIQMVNEDGTLGTIISGDTNSETTMMRIVKNGVIMSPATAANIYVWLRQRLCEMGVDVNDL